MTIPNIQGVYKNDNVIETGHAEPTISQPQAVQTAFKNLAESTESTNKSSLFAARMKILAEKNYQDLTQHIDPKVKEEIENKITGLENAPQKKQILITALEKADMEHEIFTDPDYPYLALSALREGKISKGPFVTLMIYWSIQQHHKPEEIRTVRLFDESGNINPEAQQIITETLITWTSPIKAYAFLSPWALEKFFQSMEDSTPFEQQFFVIRDVEFEFEKRGDANPQSLEPLLTGKKTISQEIARSTGINVFSRFKTEKLEDMRMIPSYTMMEAYLYHKDRNPANDFSMHPVIGLSTVEAIKNNGKTNSRDIAIPFPGIALPKVADCLQVRQTYDFIYHDFYHAIITSAIPEKHQKAYILIAELIESLKENPEFEPCKEFLEEYFERIIDMEYSSYFISPPGIDIDESTFWVGVNDLLKYTYTRHSLSNFLNDFKETGTAPFTSVFEKYASVFNTFATKTNAQISKLKLMLTIAKLIEEKKSEFSALGITFEPLKQFSKNIREQNDATEFTPEEKKQIIDRILILQLQEVLYPD